MPVPKTLVNLRWVVVAVAGLSVFALLLLLDQRLAGKEQILLIESNSPNAGSLQIFFDSGSGFNEENSRHLPFREGESALMMSLPLDVTALRIDPSPGTERIEIKSATLSISTRSRPLTVDLSRIRPVHDIDVVSRLGSGVAIIPRQGDADPQVLLESDRFSQFDRESSIFTSLLPLLAASVVVVAAFLLLIRRRPSAVSGLVAAVLRSRATEGLTALAAVLVLVAAVYVRDSVEIHLNFNASSAEPGSLQLFYAGEHGFSEQNSQVFGIDASAMRYKTEPLADISGNRVRIDPEPGMSAVRLCGLNFQTGSTHWPVGLDMLSGSSDVSIAMEQGCAVLRVDPLAKDPQAYLDIDHFKAHADAASTANSVLFAGLLLLGLLLAAVAIWLAIRRGGQMKVGFRWLPLAYAVIALGFGTGYVVITPPGAVPDEGAHLAKTVLVANGHWLGGKSPDNLKPSPEALKGQFTDFLNPASKFNVADVVQYAAAPLRCEPVEGPVDLSAAGYSPMMYVASAAVLLTACRLDGSVGEFFYAARWLNLLLAVALTCIGIRSAGPMGWPLAIIALLPMTLFEQASLTADSLTFGLSFLVIGLNAGLANAHLRRSSTLELFLVLASMALAFTKPGAAWLCVGFLLTWPSYRDQPKRFFALCGLAILLPWAIHVLWVLATAKYGISRMNVDVSANVQMILQEPLSVLGLFWNSMLGEGSTFIGTSLIGRLGWLDVLLPTWAYSLGCMAIMAAMLMKGDEVAPQLRGHRPIVILLASGACLLPIMPMYLYWTSQGSPIVQGLQGRYFIPMLAFAGTWVSVRFVPTRLLVTLYSVVSLLLLNVTAYQSLVLRYFS